MPPKGSRKASIGQFSNAGENFNSAGWCHDGFSLLSIKISAQLQVIFLLSVCVCSRHNLCVKFLIKGSWARFLWPVPSISTPRITPKKGKPHTQARWAQARVMQANWEILGHSMGMLYISQESFHSRLPDSRQKHSLWAMLEISDGLFQKH